MDFTFTEEEEAAREAATAVFDGQVTPERVRQVEATDDRFDRDLWATLARSELLGMALPERDGGGGLGMVALCRLLVAQGRTVAPVPLWSTIVTGARPLAAWGTDEQRRRWLPGVIAGDVVLTAALADVAGPSGAPAVTASPDPASGSWKLSGTLAAVPWAHVADRVLVPASTGDGVVVAVVDPRSPGVTSERAVTTNREIHPHLHLDGVSVDEGDLLGGGDPTVGAAILARQLDEAWTGLAALSVGVSHAAVAQTAEYLNQRVQFERPLSSFQGTMLRAADAAIDAAAIEAVLWQAAWRLDAGLDATEAVAVAKWWAAEAGQRVVHATQHLHGGMGADVDYPIHRYFLWGKQIELLLGGPSAQLARLGDLLADRLVAEAAAAAGAVAR